MNQWYQYLAPPALGAFIGYMTNYVAIRMLFKPLKPWYFLGVRVPMTPGVIPSKRHDLAENIGGMVGDHLLTGTDVQKALAAEKFQVQLGELINERIAKIMALELGPVASLVPERFRYQFKAGIRILRWRSLKHLHLHLRSDAFAKIIATTIDSRLRDFCAKDLKDILPAEISTKLHGALEDGVAKFMASPEVKKWLHEYLAQKITVFLAEDGTIDDLIPERVRLPLLDLLASQTPQLLLKLAKMLDEPLMQDKIVGGICKAINSFIGSLGPMAAMVSGFIKPDVIEAKIREYLAAKGGEITDWLLDEKVQAKVAAILREKAVVFMATPVAKHLESVDPQTVDQARDWLAGRLTALINDPATIKSVTTLVGDAIKDQEERTLAEIISSLAGPDGISRGADWLSGELTAVFRSVPVKRLIDRLLTDLIEGKLLTQPIGTLKSFLPHEVQNGMGEYLTQQVNDLLVREVPPLVETLNIRQIVARKVDSLDLLRLEDLLLSIMSEQFKYINLFGGLLGFIIGLLNLIFLLG